MLDHLPIRVVALVFSAALAPLAHAQTLSASTDHPAGLYTRGETVHFQIKADGDLPPITYDLKSNGAKSLKSGTLKLQDHAASLDFTPDAPGALLLELKAHPAGAPATAKDIKAAAGALICPSEIKPSTPRPDDFDAFWKSKLDDLAKIPANPQLKEVPNIRSGVTYYKITLDNINSTHVQGQLALPAEAAGKKFPALLIVQWAGVYGLDKNTVTSRAAQGFLALNIEAHDLPIDESPAFYKAQSDGPLKNYPGIGGDSRDTCYFLRMVLGCYQAAEYLAHRPDWDGKTLIVTGTSQGGMQTLITAGLHPKISAAAALVPAGCDLTAALAGDGGARDPGWPKPNIWTFVKSADPKKVLETFRYFDAVNFTPRIKCPILVGMGLIDTTCPPAGVYAACNQINSPTELVVLPKSEHQDHGGSQARFNQRLQAWLSELQKGNPAPIPAANTLDPK